MTALQSSTHLRSRGTHAQVTRQREYPSHLYAIAYTNLNSCQTHSSRRGIYQPDCSIVTGTVRSLPLISVVVRTRLVTTSHPHTAMPCHTAAIPSPSPPYTPSPEKIFQFFLFFYLTLEKIGIYWNKMEFHGENVSCSHFAERKSVLLTPTAV